MENRALNKEFWNQRYVDNNAGWDLGEVSPPLKEYIDTLTNKSLRILIPGCGNSYEADYLLQKGFTNITIIDIAPDLVQRLKEKHKENSNIKILLGDFFEHASQYDLILEQTFFCALDPALRKKYVSKMHELLAEGEKLVGLLFNKVFEEAGPPFGGSAEEYKILFLNYFKIERFEECKNSFLKRQGAELFIDLKKI